MTEDLNNNNTNLTYCPEHGEQQKTFVCHHLENSLHTGQTVGFFCEQDDFSNPRPDAWCAKCEEKRISYSGDYNDEFESFADFMVLCGICYDKTRMINDKPQDAWQAAHT